MSQSARAIPPFFTLPFTQARRALPRPTVRAIAFHSFLFLLTCATATIAGILLASRGNFPEPVLADYPHPNGWDLKEKDVFEGNILTEEIKKAQILFCNPPFEDFISEQKTYYRKFNKDLLTQKPAEILRQIMQNPPTL